MKHLFYILNLILFLAVFNMSIWKKEQTLQNGKTIYLELAPKDPRSLFQGDYMSLRYAIIDTLNWNDSLSPATGFCVLTMDSLKIAQNIHYQETNAALGSAEVPVRFHYNNGRIQIGAESYFFEEAKGYTLDSARYGGLKVSENGECILIGLYDRHLQYLDTRKDSTVLTVQ